MGKKTLLQVANEVEHDQRGKIDYVLPFRNLYMDDNGGFAFKRVNEVQIPYAHESTARQADVRLEPNDWATGQLLGRLNMPAEYFKRLLTQREAAPWLFASHFNYWASRTNKHIRLRAKLYNGNGTGVVRGAVSDKYSILDNDTVISTLAGIMQGREDDFEIVDFHLDDRRMNLRVAYNDLAVQLGNLPGGEADWNKLGSDFVNSEVGASAFNLQALIWRLICSNGLRGWDQQGEAFTQRHIHLRPIEFQGRIADAIVNSLQTGQDFLNAFKDTQEKQINDPFAVIKKLANDGNFSRQFTDQAVSEWEGHDTAYGVVNAFTRAARTLPNERRLEAESYAGRLTRLPAEQWDKISEEAILETA